MYIDIEKAKEEFLKYVSNYDLTDDKIILKKEHSLRVMDVSRKIAEMMNLNDEDKELAILIGLLHDIARFEQVKKYDTFNDFLSFDHGNYGAEILNNDLRKYIETNKYDEIIKKAVKNHNKFELEENLSEKEIFFSKLIRDADKLDILYESVGMFWIGKDEEINSSEVTPEILESFFNKEQIKKEAGKKYKEIDSLIFVIAFIFDINFKESFYIIKRENYLNKLINRFSFKGIEEIRTFVNSYINEKTI